jgi:SAM-dependent methyltransferase
MDIPVGHEGNADQIAYWNGPGGQRWTDRQQAQDIMLAPVADILIDRARVKAGERIIDVGCGCGATTSALAQKAGPKGHVLGVDISAPMLARARQVASAGLGIDFALADATVYPFEPASFDLLVSRFGVMFFAEPALSFAASGGLQARPKAAAAGTGRPGSVCIRLRAARQPDPERGRIFGRRDGAVRPRPRHRDRARPRGGGRSRAGNRPGQPRAGGPTRRTARRCHPFDPRSAGAFRQSRDGAARRIDLDRDRGSVVKRRC